MKILKITSLITSILLAGVSNSHSQVNEGKEALGALSDLSEVLSESSFLEDTTTAAILARQSKRLKGLGSVFALISVGIALAELADGAPGDTQKILTRLDEIDDDIEEFRQDMDRQFEDLKAFIELGFARQNLRGIQEEIDIRYETWKTHFANERKYLRAVNSVPLLKKDLNDLLLIHEAQIARNGQSFMEPAIARTRARIKAAENAVRPEAPKFGETATDFLEKAARIKFLCDDGDLLTGILRQSNGDRKAVEMQAANLIDLLRKAEIAGAAHEAADQLRDVAGLSEAEFKRAQLRAAAKAVVLVENLLGDKRRNGRVVPGPYSLCAEGLEREIDRLTSPDFMRSAAADFVAELVFENGRSENGFSKVSRDVLKDRDNILQSRKKFVDFLHGKLEARFPDLSWAVALFRKTRGKSISSVCVVRQSLPWPRDEMFFTSAGVDNLWTDIRLTNVETRSTGQCSGTRADHIFHLYVTAYNAAPERTKGFRSSRDQLRKFDEELEARRTGTQLGVFAKVKRFDFEANGSSVLVLRTETDGADIQITTSGRTSYNRKGHMAWFVAPPL